MTGPEVVVTEADWRAAQAQRGKRLVVMATGTLVAIPALALLARAAGDTASGRGWRLLITFVVMLLLLVPVDLLLLRWIMREQDKADRLVGALTGQLSGAVAAADVQAAQRGIQARRQELESRLANALEMSQGEPEVIEVIERAFAAMLPRTPVELLLADNSHAHLLRMAQTDPAGSFSGCGVESPDQCPAARRAQTQRFIDSEALDACPKLRGRPEGAVSAMCVPVSIMGRTVGVVHATDAPGTEFTAEAVQDMGMLAKLAGARVGLLRVMAETQLQAATDSLTGLLNRRSFEQKVSAARRAEESMCLVMADLDHFKELNDTYGHETGDRALRLFAQVMAGSVRAQDLICRHGGEEFVVALSGCTLQDAPGILETMRSRLEAAITVAALPLFTASFGVVEVLDQEGLSVALARADAALFQAKREGRNRVVVHDVADHTVVEPPIPGTPPITLVQQPSAPAHS